MAINPFVLPQGVAGLQYGLNPQRQQAPQQQPQQRPQMDPRVRNAGLVEALSSPVSVESGGIPEAIAEALAVGLRGRAARRERQTELDTETRTQKIEDDDRAMERRVQEAQIARALAGAEGEQPDPALEAAISRLPQDQQDLARMNPQAFVGGIMRHRYPAPQRGGIGEEESDADGWSYSN
jgi:hypothetical protein